MVSPSLHDCKEQGLRAPFPAPPSHTSLGSVGISEVSGRLS